MAAADSPPRDARSRSPPRRHSGGPPPLALLFGDLRFTAQGGVHARTLGRGAFSKVKLAVSKLTGEPVAVKVIDKPCLPDLVRKLLPEPQLLLLLSHPNIVRLLAVAESPSWCLCAMEYLPHGCLSTVVPPRGLWLEEAKARNYFRQLLLAIHHAHARGVVHRDLKPENVMLSDWEEGAVGTGVSDPPTFCGTPNFAAPELVSGQPYDATLSDAWALGVLLYLLLHPKGSLPFSSPNSLAHLYTLIRACSPDYSAIPDGPADLLRAVFVRDPDRRLNVECIMRDPWVNQ
ncbi:kinase-like domain-containing protein, partial [Hyaloraphidium curvatum]